MGIAIRDAARLSGTDQRWAEEVENRHAALTARIGRAREAQDRRQVTELTRCLAGQPLFVTTEEFDDWMRDPTTTIVLDPDAR